MAQEPLRAVLDHIRRIAARQEADVATDAELLDRYVRHGDEAAFEAIVRRHNNMVFHICRRVLHHTQDTEDAVQATFMMLVRRAASIRRRQALASWLHQVAFRVARRTQTRTRQRTQLESPSVEEPAILSDNASKIEVDELTILDEEVCRLPEKYRLPIILCYLGGKTTEEAARVLGCPRGTVLSRLAWARERLRLRLTRRGLAASAGSLLTFVAQPAESAPAVVLQATVQAACGYAASRTAAGVFSSRAVTLMEGVLRDMFLIQMMKWGMAVVLAAVIGASVGLQVYRPIVADPLERKKDDETNPRIVRRSKASRPRVADAIDRAKDEETSQPSQQEPDETPPTVRGRDSLIGDWERNAGPFRIKLHFTEDEVIGNVTVSEGNQKISFEVGAEYAKSKKESVLFGFITDVTMDGTSSNEDVPKQEFELIDLLLGLPFSTRFRLSGDHLTIMDLKGNIAKDGDQKVSKLLLGRYKRIGTSGKKRTAP